MQLRTIDHSITYNNLRCPLHSVTTIHNMQILQSQINRNRQDTTSVSSSPQTLTGGTPTAPSYFAHQPTTPVAAAGALADTTTAVATAASPLPFAAVALIKPLGVATLRDDSTESEHSLTGSQSQSEALQRFM